MTYAQKTWESELEAMDLREVVVEYETEIEKVWVDIQIDERYTILPGHTGPRLYCTTCGLFVRPKDLGIQLAEIVKIAVDHESLNHYCDERWSD